MIQIHKLTIGESARVERLAGIPLQHLGDDDKPGQMLLLAAAVFVWLRRTNKELTWEQVQEWEVETIQSYMVDDAPDAEGNAQAATELTVVEAPTPSK